MTSANTILQQVKANMQKLMTCELHDFQDITPTKQIGKRYKCTKCEGEVDGLAYSWYRKGLKHAMAGVVKAVE
jgi:hypothetical protein